MSLPHWMNSKARVIHNLDAQPLYIGEIVYLHAEPYVAKTLTEWYPMRHTAEAYTIGVIASATDFSHFLTFFRVLGGRGIIIHRMAEVSDFDEHKPNSIIKYGVEYDRMQVEEPEKFKLFKQKIESC